MTGDNYLKDRIHMQITSASGGLLVDSSGNYLLDSSGNYFLSEIQELDDFRAEVSGLNTGTYFFQIKKYNREIDKREYFLGGNILPSETYY